MKVTLTQKSKKEMMRVIILSEWRKLSVLVMEEATRTNVLRQDNTDKFWYI